jgi:hypothetical protein
MTTLSLIASSTMNASLFDRFQLLSTKKQNGPNLFSLADIYAAPPNA